jgi:hypothetical protein
MARFDWETIRAEYEAGATQGELSRRHGCSRGAVQKHIAAEGWVQDVRPVLERLTAEKVAGVVAGSDPVKKAIALAKEADKRVEVVMRHRGDWEDLRRFADSVDNFEGDRRLKLKAEALKILQEGERKAWGLEITATPYSDSSTPATQRVQVAVLVDRAPVAGGVLSAILGASGGN